MQVRDRSPRVFDIEDQSEVVEETLASICRGLLERPSGRRGPFDIPDSELRSRTRPAQATQLRLAST